MTLPWTSTDYTWLHQLDSRSSRRKWPAARECGDGARGRLSTRPIRDRGAARPDVGQAQLHARPVSRQDSGANDPVPEPGIEPFPSGPALGPGDHRWRRHRCPGRSAAGRHSHRPERSHRRRERRRDQSCRRLHQRSAGPRPLFHHRQPPRVQEGRGHRDRTPRRRRTPPRRRARDRRDDGVGGSHRRRAPRRHPARRQPQSRREVLPRPPDRHRRATSAWPSRCSRCSPGTFP